MEVEVAVRVSGVLVDLLPCLQVLVGLGQTAEDGGEGGGHAGKGPAEKGRAAAALEAILPLLATLETPATLATLEEVLEEDREWTGGEISDPTRSLLRETASRIALQKLEESVKEAALRSVGAAVNPIASQAVVGAIVNGAMPSLRKKMYKLCDVKVAAALHFGLCLYLRVAEERLFLR